MSEVRLVVRQCSECGGTTSAPENWTGTVFCRQACMDSYNEKKTFEKVAGEAATFMAANPNYYDCPYNSKLVGELLTKWKLEPTADNLDAAYTQLLAERKILGKLTRRDIDLMPSPEYDARERIDLSARLILGAGWSHPRASYQTHARPEEHGTVLKRRAQGRVSLLARKGWSTSFARQIHHLA